MSTSPTRPDVPEAERWNRESVFRDVEAFEATLAAVSQRIGEVDRFEGTLDRGPERLAEWLAFQAELQADYGKLVVYANMAYSVDTGDKDASRDRERVYALGGRLDSAIAFARPELLSVGIGTLRTWIRDHDGLQDYEHWVERLEKQAPHVRTAEVETLLGALATPFQSATQAHGVLANAELPFPEVAAADGEGHDITQANIKTHLQSRDRTLREGAYKAYADTHLAFQDTMAQILSTGIRQNNLLASSRRYESALHAALEPEDLPLEVFTNLLDTFRDNLGTWHRFWRAKRAMLGVEALQPWDVHAGMAETPPQIPFERSVGWLADALAPLGREYVEIMRRGSLQQRWVDRAPNKGKRMGAFSSGVKGTHPFIMMSYTDDVFGMSTLAHELGHSMHSHFTFQHQPQVYSRYSLFVAEVASNFNQAMLRAHLFERFPDDRELQIALIDEAMANFYRYFLVMPTLARFEWEIHQRVDRGEALGAEALGELMADLFAEAYGDEIVMDRDRVGSTWAQFHTHLYARFYVYQYATGISGAHALARRIQEGEEGAAEAYLTFLRAGGSKFPLDALRDAGVDLASPTPVRETFQVLEGLVERLEGLL